MPVYEAKQNADTWNSYMGGVLSDKTTIVRAGERIVAVDLGSVLHIADGRYTKEIWFNLIPESPSPLPPTTPTESRNVTITITELGWQTITITGTQNKNVG